MSPIKVMPLLLTGITSCVIAFGESGTTEAQVRLAQFQPPQGQQGDDQKKKPQEQQRGGQQEQQRGGGGGRPDQGGGRPEQRAQPETRQQPRSGQDQGFGQRDRGGQQEQRGQAQDRGRQEFEPRKVQEQERPRQQPEQKKVQEQDQFRQPQGGRFGQDAQQPGGIKQGSPAGTQPGGTPSGQPQGGRFGQGAPSGAQGQQGQAPTGSAIGGGQGAPQQFGTPGGIKQGSPAGTQPGGTPSGQPQGGRFGQGAPSGAQGQQGQTPTGSATGGQGSPQQFGTPGGIKQGSPAGTQQGGTPSGQPQGGRFGEGTPQGTPGVVKPQGQGAPGFGVAPGQQGTPPAASGGIRPGFPGGTQQGEGPSAQPQGGRFGQGAPGGAQPQGQGPAGQGPAAGFGAGGPQIGGAQPQTGNRPPFGAGFSPEQRREIEERDTRRIELGRKIEEDQRRTAEHERSREGLEERTRLQNERFRDIHSQRHERTDPNGIRFIEEPGNRKIFRLNNQTFIRHDETVNFNAYGGRQERRRGPGGNEFTTFHRPDGSRVEVEVDGFGRPIRRVRILPDGRRYTLFENRALAAGLGLAAIGAAIVLLPPPAIAIPRDDYIVDAGVASEETIYDTLYAPPVEPLPRSYSLDEVLASPNLRDRMRSVRLNTIHFEFGSWEVRPDQAPLLQGIADSINRIVQNNPGEVFLIEGHTDAVGSDEDNLSLSDRRAQAVADVLTQYYQVPRESLVTQGYGKQFLLVPTQGPEIRNRRVVIRRLTPLLQSDQGRYSNSGGPGPQNNYRP